MGARVIIACRSEIRARAAIMRIKADHMEFNELSEEERLWDYPLISEPRVEFMYLDLSSLESVQRFIQEFKMTGYSLNTLICNAGVVMVPFEKTVDGYEKHFQVNYLSHFYLTLEMLPLLEKADDARIVLVSSKLHESGNFSFKTLQGKTKYDRSAAYANSKLYMVMLMFSLKRRLAGKKINVFCADPGLVHTNASKNFRDDKTLMTKYKMAKAFGMLQTDITVGAATIINAAINPHLEEMNATYFRDCIPVTPAISSRNQKLQEVLWTYSLKCLLGENQSKEKVLNDESIQTLRTIFHDVTMEDIYPSK
ncbi:DgyrCDS7008 [Dimorphilus gyrociliatus]|nr:DgyrCDS7008 [Dimorphilus gyrociliatus]